MRLKRRPLRLRLEIMELYDWKAHAQMRRGEDAKAKTRRREVTSAHSPSLVRLIVFTFLSSRLRTFEFRVFAS